MPKLSVYVQENHAKQVTILPDGSVAVVDLNKELTLWDSDRGTYGVTIHGQKSRSDGIELLTGGIHSCQFIIMFSPKLNTYWIAHRNSGGMFGVILADVAKLCNHTLYEQKEPFPIGIPPKTELSVVVVSSNEFWDKTRCDTQIICELRDRLNLNITGWKFYGTDALSVCYYYAARYDARTDVLCIEPQTSRGQKCYEDRYANVFSVFQEDGLDATLSRIYPPPTCCSWFFCCSRQKPTEELPTVVTTNAAGSIP